LQLDILPDLFLLERASDGALLSRHVEKNPRGDIFGGFLLGQSLSAAAFDLPAGLTANNLQLNFLSPGRPNCPMRYDIEPLHDGRNFVVRQVLGKQGDRKVISASVSFHRGEYGPSFQQHMPRDLPDPESLPTLQSIMQRNAHRLQPHTVESMAHSWSLDIRLLHTERDLFDRSVRGSLQFWVRARQPLPGDQVTHQAVLAYLSDYWFPLTSLTPTTDKMVETGLYIASLNHSIWFHRPVRADEWLFVDAVTPSSNQARGLTTGQIYAHGGTLVATAAQEVLYRGWVDRDGVASAPAV